MASSATPVKAPPAASGAVLSAAGQAATAAAWRRGVALTAEDTRRALRPDVASPFASLDDAVARLLPYHVFGAEEGDEADVDEAAATGGTLLASRLAQWDDMCLRKAGDFVVTLKRQTDALDEALAKRAASSGALRVEEAYLAARLVLDEQRLRHAAGRAALNARNATMGLGPLASAGAQGQGAPAAAVARPLPHADMPLALVPQPTPPPGEAAAGREFAQPLGAGRAAMAPPAAAASDAPLQS